MPIHPIEYRYGSPEMRKVFSRESWLEKMLKVEAALVQAYADVGEIPEDAARYISERASTSYVSVEAVDRIEREIGHEIMAVVKALAEVSEPYGGFIHMGATSNDITDSVLALQLKEAIKIVRKDLAELAGVLVGKAETYKDTVCLGRTHGIAALPMPFGFKFAVWASEVTRHIKRLSQCEDRVCVGKMSGAVGTMAGFGPNALRIQETVMERLGIRPATIATQVVPRDGLAEFITLLGVIASTLDKIANEVRNLQRTEIREVEEPFREERQVGSSSMPHKRNPEKSEKVCGLARVIRGFTVTALENIVLEHERDLTNSSCERVMVPEVCILLDEQLKTILKVLKGLIVYPENMVKNLKATRGLIMSEAITLTLAKKGPGRQWAHEVVRRCSMEAWKRQVTLPDVLKQNPEVTQYLSEQEIDALMDPVNYLGKAKEQIGKVTAYVRSTLPQLVDTTHNP